MFFPLRLGGVGLFLLYHLKRILDGVNVLLGVSSGLSQHGGLSTASTSPTGGTETTYDNIRVYETDTGLRVELKPFE